MSAQAKRAMNARSNRTTVTKVCLALVMFGLMASLATAQQYDQSAQDPQKNSRNDSRRYPATSELTRGNLSRVAASPGQIREVLVKDIGLMVELKRWVARDAADSGQVVEDSSLTDDAIFERLERDVVFRSYATLLLQRYGYLTATLNPESELGKQQEL